MFERKIDFISLLKKKSYFIFGPRSTGKTFWLKKSLTKEIFYIDLLNSQNFMRLSENPGLLPQMIEAAKTKFVVIDEIQRIPELLNEVHRSIEESGVKFLLTGSSARRLKREHANLLGGRAGRIDFFPLSFSEIPNFNLTHYMQSGGLPRAYLAEDYNEELEAYVKNYFEQEVKIEANVRNLLPFTRFLKVAALSNGELINYAGVGSDCGVAASTVRDYFSILEDTLLGHTLEPWVESKKRKAIQTSKFYLFDTGVCRYLMDIEKLDPKTEVWGRFFEQFILTELKCYISYRQKRKKIFFWRTVNKQEVDFIIEGSCGIEVKSTSKIKTSQLSGLKALQEEKMLKNYFIISNDPIYRIEDDIEIIPWKTFLEKLWNDEIF